MAEVLKSTEMFLQLLSDLDLQKGPQTEPLPGDTGGEEPVRSPRKTQQLTGTSSKTGNKKTSKNSSNDASATLPQENLQQSPNRHCDNSLHEELDNSPRMSPSKSSEQTVKVVKPKPVRKIATSESSEVDKSPKRHCDNSLHEELDNSPRRSPRKSQSKSSEQTVKVVKPKPVRKIATSESSEVDKKKLKQVAEDLAITSLSQSTSRQTNPEDDETGHLIKNSLNLIHDGQTAFQPQPSCSTVTYQEQEMSCLKNRLDYAEYQIRYIWSEMQVMKNEMDQLRSSNAHSHIHANQTVQDSFNQSINDQSQSNEEQSGATHLVFSGFTKDQVMAKLRHYKSPQKGTTRIFRMLFTIEETEGRSLFGMRKGSQNGVSDVRPALADKAKLKFLEDCVLEKWPTTPRTEIWRVIRHLLKPSRNSKMNC